jgi:uncharacterized protein
VQAVTADDVIARFSMRPIPDEGGWFHRTWQGTASADGRACGTAILALFTDRPGGASRRHRLDAAETWTFVDGDPFGLVVTGLDGRHTEILLGRPSDALTCQYTVEPGCWMSGATTGAWSLIGCTMAPGFEPTGFELGR